MEAQLFDGTVLEFPDNTDPAVMRRVVKQKTDAIRGASPSAPQPTTAAAPPAAPSMWKDIPASLASGIARGAAETVMLPVTATRLLESAAQYGGEKGDDLIRHIMGADPVSAEQRAADRQKLNDGPLNIMKYINPVQDAARGVMDDNLYAPKTTPGKYAETVGEFIPSAVVPGAAGRAAATTLGRVGNEALNVLSNAVVPGAASEAAGEAAAGTPYEPAARIAGALAGNVGPAVIRASNGPEAAIRRHIGTVEPDWNAARTLQDNRFGVPLTGPEAIAQSNPGNGLPVLQRIVEGSSAGKAATGPFFAARPAQIDQAVGGVLDQVAPQSTAPSTLGPRVAEAADNVLNLTRQDINAQTRPLYQAAEPQLIPDAQFAPIRSDPRFAAGLARLRADPELGPDYARLPDNSIGVVDAVTKDMTSRGEAMRNQANPLYGPERGMRNTSGAANARYIARDPTQGGSADYDQALTTQAQLRRDQLEPLQQGPVGRIASATDTPSAAEAILPRNPMVGSRDEVLDAVTRLSAEDPQNTAGLVRQALADRYSAAGTATQGGNREFVGAKFAQNIAGNDTRREVLDAVMQGANSPARTDIPNLLDVLEATGRRMPIGSGTSFNNAEMENLGAGSPLGRLFDLVKSGGTTLVTKAGDAAGRARLGRNITDLADMFTDPHSVELLQAAYGRRAPNGLAEAMARTAAEGGSTFRDRSN